MADVDRALMLGHIPVRQLREPLVRRLLNVESSTKTVLGDAHCISARQICRDDRQVVVDRELQVRPIKLPAPAAGTGSRDQMVDSPDTRRQRFAARSIQVLLAISIELFKCQRRSHAAGKQSSQCLGPQSVLRSVVMDFAKQDNRPT